jgi:hypothetical protein
VGGKRVTKLNIFAPEYNTKLPDKALNGTDVHGAAQRILISPCGTKDGSNKHFTNRKQLA